MTKLIQNGLKFETKLCKSQRKIRQTQVKLRQTYDNAELKPLIKNKNRSHQHSVSRLYPKFLSHMKLMVCMMNIFIILYTYVVLQKGLQLDLKKNKYIVQIFFFFLCVVA